MISNPKRNDLMLKKYVSTKVRWSVEEWASGRHEVLIEIDS